MTSNPLAVPEPDLAAAAAAGDRRSHLPPGTLGDLAVLVDAVAALRGGPPIAPRAPHLAVFAGDHGVAAREITGDAPAATGRLATEIAAGRGPIGGLAAETGVSVGVLDVAVDAEDTPAGLRPARVRRSSGSIDVGDALTMAEVATAIQLGRDEATSRIDAGSDLLIGAVCGVGVDVSGVVLAAALTGMEPVDVVGRGTGVNDAAWSRRVTAVRDALLRVNAGGRDAASLLRSGGGADIAALTGFTLQAAVRGVPVLLDDVPGAVAGVLAQRFAPGAGRYVLVPSMLPDRAHGRLLDLLAGRALLSIALGSGPAVPSLLLLTLLRAAAGTVDRAVDAPTDRAPWSIDEWDRKLL